MEVLAEMSSDEAGATDDAHAHMRCHPFLVVHRRTIAAPCPAPAELHIGMIGFLLKASADSLARLTVELQDREYLDDADITVIEAQLSSAKKAIARIETALAAPNSKACAVSPMRDEAFVEGGI